MKFLPFWKHPRVFAEQLLGFLVLGTLLYWWLGLAESGALQTILSVATALAIVAGIVVLATRARHQLGPVSPGIAQRLLAAVVMAILLFGAYELVVWVPAVGGFTMQLVSVIVRFGIAVTLAMAGWLNLWRGVPGSTAEPVSR